MYGYRCEYCDGTVREKVVEREAFKYEDRFIILEDVPIGMCDRCGNHYYNARIVKVVEALATGKKPADREQTVLVGHI